MSITPLITATLLVTLSCAQSPTTLATTSDKPAAGTPGAGWRLAESQSPYLRQHADNTVAWREWGDAAFKEAAEADKPVFLSIGYSSCHWCHVMEHETFEDPEIGALLDKHFVSIKLDREQYPAVDAHYMTATTAMNQGRGGWPMTVFMTPEGEPFFTGTYFPPREKFGRPGFTEILQTIITDWTNARDNVAEYATSVHDFLKQDRLGANATWSGDDLTRATRALATTYDPIHGGYRGGPKFPPSQALRFAIARHLRDANEMALDGIVLALDGMAWGGLRDHIGGGFHRYTVDAEWRIPHFEKMLYDNAQLIALYAEGYALTGEERFARVVRDTIAWAQREMLSEAGTYFSAQDADSLPFDADTLAPIDGAHIEEGLFYAWTPAQLVEALGPDDAARAAELLEVTDDGTFEHGLSHVQPRRTPDERAAWFAGVTVAELSDDQRTAADAWWTDVRARLDAAREPRPRPFLDEKCLASWNGLMLTGLARAASLLDDDEIRASTQNLAYSITRRFMLKRRDAHVDLVHQFFEGTRSGEATLSDYSAIARGMLDAYEATGDATLLYQSLRTAREMLTLFEDAEGGFWETRAVDPLLGTRMRDVTDGAVPAGSSMAIETLVRLAPFDDSGAFLTSAERALERVMKAASGNPRAFPSVLVAADAFLGPLAEIVIAGMPGDESYDQLVAEARRTLLPARLLISDAAAASDVFAGTDEHPALLEGRRDDDGGGTVWVCTRGVCLLPVETVDDLAAQLLTFRGTER